MQNIEYRITNFEVLHSIFCGSKRYQVMDCVWIGCDQAPLRDPQSQIRLCRRIHKWYETMEWIEAYADI